MSDYEAIVTDLTNQFLRDRRDALFAYLHRNGARIPIHEFDRILPELNVTVGFDEEDTMDLEGLDDTDF